MQEMINGLKKERDALITQHESAIAAQGAIIVENHKIADKAQSELRYCARMAAHRLLLMYAYSGCRFTRFERRLP